MKKALILLISIMTTSAAAAPAQIAEKLAEGAAIQLKQALTVQAKGFSILFRGNEILPKYKDYPRTPYCELRMRRTADKARTLPAEHTLEITDYSEIRGVDYTSFQILFDDRRVYSLDCVAWESEDFTESDFAETVGAFFAVVSEEDRSATSAP